MMMQFWFRLLVLTNSRTLVCYAVLADQSCQVLAAGGINTSCFVNGSSRVIDHVLIKRATTGILSSPMSDV